MSSVAFSTASAPSDCLADELEVVLALQDHLQTPAEQRVIVDDHHTRSRSASCALHRHASPNSAHGLLLAIVVGVGARVGAESSASGLCHPLPALAVMIADLPLEPFHHSVERRQGTSSASASARNVFRGIVDGGLDALSVPSRRGWCSAMNSRSMRVARGSSREMAAQLAARPSRGPRR